METPLSAERIAQILHGFQRIRMFRAEQPAIRRIHSLLQALGFAVLALVNHVRCQVVHRF
jgi:hypothetical protein